MHDVQRVELRVGGGERRRNDGEVLGDVVGDAEGGERAARHQHLLAGLDDLDELGRVGVEVDHVAGFLGRLRAGVHRHRHVGLRQRRRVVGAVAGHRHQPPCALVLADQLELGLRRGFGEEVVDAGLGGDRRGGERVVAGDHDGLDAHAAQLGEALLDAALDDVLELDDAEHARVVADDQRRAAAARDVLRRARGRPSGSAAERLDVPARWRRLRPCAPGASPRSTPLMRVCAEKGTKVAPSAPRSRSRRLKRCLASTTMLRPSGVSSASEASCAASASSSSLTPARRNEGRRLAVAERDGAGLVEQQHVDVAGRLDRAAGGGDDVRLHHAAHAGDADGRQQRRRWWSGSGTPAARPAR